MSFTRTKEKSLAGTVFRTVLVFSLTIILVLSIVLIGIFYTSSEDEAEETLLADAEAVVEILNGLSSDERIEVLSQQFSEETRYTLIAEDGTVLYDSLVDASTLENHADRPEVEEAGENGEAVVSRYSVTFSDDAIYAAATLDGGEIIRLAQTRESLAAFVGDMLVPLIIALVVAVVVSALVSRALTRRIMQPIGALDFSEPLKNDIYAEMKPLLIRIDEQQSLLKQQNQELAEANNMRRDFSANVSHEMKTPLQVISGYAELMKEGVVAPEDYQRFSGLIYDEAQKLRSLINDVLVLSKLDESAFERDIPTCIDLLETSRVAASHLESLAKERKVEVSVVGEQAMIMGSDTLAEEMMHNLIENGIRYNHEGGSVVVSVGHESVPHAAVNADRGVTPQQAIVLRRSSPSTAMEAQMQVVVRVTDTGIGIAPEEQDKIFERFYRVEKSRSKETGGTGLGLAIVKHAVLYHSGTIEVHSELGHGSTFELRFPTAEERNPELQKGQAQLQEVQAQSDEGQGEGEGEVGEAGAGQGE